MNPKKHRLMDLALSRQAIVGLLLVFAIAGFAKSHEEEDIAKLLETPQGFFEALGFNESYRVMLLDHQSMSEDENEALLRILSRIDRPQQYRVLKWLQFEVDWEKLHQQPEEVRLNYYQITGKTTNIKRIELIEELHDSFDFDHYYEVKILIENDVAKDQPVQVLIYVLNIPDRWQQALESNVEIQQPISAAACFLKQASPVDQVSLPVFVTSKLSWHPDQVDSDIPCNAGEVLLGSHGLDVGEFDLIKDRTEFKAEERESFYQMLAATSLIEPTEIDTARISNITIQTLLSADEAKLDQLRAQVIEFSGNVRRITKTSVEDSEIAQRLGIKHFYEIELFISLDNPIGSQIGTDESTRKVFQNAYPIVIGCRELPSGIEEGDDVNYPISFQGFFYKLWAYKTQFMSAEIKNRRQVSPFLIANSFQVQDRSTQDPVDYAIAWLLLSLILISGCAVAAGYLFTSKPRSKSKK